MADIPFIFPSHVLYIATSAGEQAEFFFESESLFTNQFWPDSQTNILNQKQF